MCTRYWALGGGRQGGQAPKPKGLTPYPAVRGLVSRLGPGLPWRWSSRGPQRRVPEALTSSPMLGARCKKRRGKKGPPLWTIDQGRLLGGRSWAELPGAGEQGSEGGLRSKGSLRGMRGGEGFYSLGQAPI